MQNLPITATPPASPVQQPVATDSNATQAAEPFSNVLARQRANASTPAGNTGARDSKHATPSSASDASTDSGNKQSAELQTLAPDTVSAPPGKLIPAGLLLVTPATDTVASSEKTDPLAPTPDAVTVTALPGDMLAALLPASVTTSSVNTSSITTNEKDRQREHAPVEDSTLPGDMLATLRSAPVALQERIAAMRPKLAGAANVADATGQARPSASIQDAPLLYRTQGNTEPAALVAATAHDSTFSAALEAMSKEGAKTAQPGASATEFSTQAAQPDTSNNIAFLAQNGTAPISASTNGQVQVAVNTPVTHNAWGDEFGQKITWLATQHAQSAELHLNPPQLGPLDVVLKVSGDQATALFTSPHAAVRDAVEQALPRLREMLADNGIMLGNATVSDQSPKEQQAWLASQQQNGGVNLSGKAGSVVATDGIPSGGTILPVRRHQGMVDTFA